MTLIVFLLLAVTGAGLYWTPKPTTRRHLAQTARYLTSDWLSGPSPVGTSGAGRRAAVDTQLQSPGLIRDIETITGSIDGHELVGRLVDLRVPVVAHAGTSGYWVGPPDNRVLVLHQAAGIRGSNGTAAVNTIPAPGQVAAVTGIVKPLTPEDAARWALLDADRTVFILAN